MDRRVPEFLTSKSGQGNKLTWRAYEINKHLYQLTGKFLQSQDRMHLFSRL